MNSSSGKKIIATCLVLLSIACTKSKDSHGGSNISAVPTADGVGQPVAGSISTADSTRLPVVIPSDFKTDDNSGNEINFDAPISEDEIKSYKARALTFTGASEDSLRDYLMAKVEEEESLKKAKNLKFATMIESAKLKVSDDKNAFKVVIKIGKPAKYLAFTGAVEKRKNKYNGKVFELQKMNLKAFDKDGKEFKNQSGSLECLDSKFTRMFDCQTKLATINLNGATAKIILRYSGLNRSAKFPDSKCISKECDELYNLFYNTQYEVKDLNRLRSAVMETFEIINGRSAFNILLLTYQNEVIKMEGELPADENGDLDIPLNMKLISEEMKSRKTRLNTAMHSSFLQANDGNGGLRIKVRMKMDKETSDFDVFELTFTRNLNPIKVLK